jgi:uncharacterized protein
MSENKQIIRAVFDALAAGNSRPLVDTLADDVTWTVMGRTRWSGTYRGKSSVVGDIFGVLRQRLAGGYKATAQRIIAEDPYVVVQARGEASTKEGAEYNNQYCFVYRMEGGRIKEVIEYMDTELVTSALDVSSGASRA